MDKLGKNTREEKVSLKILTRNETVRMKIVTEKEKYASKRCSVIVVSHE